MVNAFIKLLQVRLTISLIHTLKSSKTAVPSLAALSGRTLECEANHIHIIQAYEIQLVREAC